MDDLRPPQHGGIGRFLVEHQGVGWLLLVALLAWGALAYTRLAQQEDPEFSKRNAQLVAVWPGATASQVEDLVTRPLEDALGENDRVERLDSESRTGVAVINVQQRYGSQLGIDQQWSDLRARISQVRLPEGCRAPVLNTDFGDVTTLLLAVASAPVADSELAARAAAIRNRLATLRSSVPAANRAAIVGLFPPAITPDIRRTLAERLETHLAASGLKGLRCIHADGFSVGEFATTLDRTALGKIVDSYVRSVAGSDAPLHPDLPLPLLLYGDEDPLPALRALKLPQQSFRALEIASEDLERRLRQLPDAGRVSRIGAVDEQVQVQVSSEALAGRRIDPVRAQAALTRRNAIVPGGALRTDGHRIPVRVDGQFTAERDVGDTVIGGSAGDSVYVRDLFAVRRGYRDPLGYRAELLERDGQALEARRSVFVAVSMRKGATIANFATEVRSCIAAQTPRLPHGVSIAVVSDQPKSVALRIATFIDCFAEAVAIVILVALALMDWRSAIVVAAAVPLSVAFTLAGFQILGIPLHQISIAALIIALGLLVDFPVVAADGINRAIAEGRTRAEAAWLGVWRLRRPMLFGTLINVVAFLPLVLMPDDKGEFIYALPVGVSLALIGAWLIARSLTPLLGAHLLAGQKGLDEGGSPRTLPPFSWIDRGLAAAMPPYRRLLERALAHPWRTLAVAYGLLLASLALAPLLGQQFFPPAERDQVIIDIRLPEPAAIAQTETVARQVVAIAAKHQDIQGGALFLGGTAPRFYYNIIPKVPDDGIAQLLLTTRRMEDVPPLVRALQDELDRAVIGARVVVRRLEQGPPVDPPIQVRVSGEDLPDLRRAADAIANHLRAAGARHVHDNLGSPVPALVIRVDQDRAALLGVDTASVGQVAAAAFQGIPVTDIREGDHLVPVVVRLQESERNEADRIRSLYITGAGGERLPLAAVADLALEPAYVNVPRFARRRAVTVMAYPPPGELALTVLDRALPELRHVALPAGSTLAFDGEAKEMAASQGEMTLILGISIALIGIALVLQFQSLGKSLAVLATVPLSLIGALVGLAAFGADIGFMAMLAIASLAGVVVSHIIVLSDCIEEHREHGLPLHEALIRAGLARLRPVLVTVLATVMGLIPLALQGGALWQPLCAVHIVGLLVGTSLTLVVLPVIYFLFATRLGWIR